MNMGGCYSYHYRTPSVRCEPAKPSWQTKLKKALSSEDRTLLTEAYKDFFTTSNSGFILEVAKIQGIKKADDIPKEFPEIEYEFKFDLQVEGKGNEPGIDKYLSAFDFPVAKSARFLKDPVCIISTGTNRFYGTKGEEKLVVITKGGNIYLKEKGENLPLNVDVPFQDLVMKRGETRYPVTLDRAVDKMVEVAAKSGAIYQGRIRKEKGDDFVLDTSDGRLYGFTITRAHLTKPADSKECGTQRQLEIEYAGYIPGFEGFKKDSEKQIVTGMVDLARYTFNMYLQTPINGSWQMKLIPTTERKFDFVSEGPRKESARTQKLLEAKLN